MNEREQSAARRRAILIAALLGALAAVSFLTLGRGFFSVSFALAAAFAALHAGTLRARTAWRKRREDAVRQAMLDRPPREEPGAYGVLGTYAIDGDDSYGLFVRLQGSPVFVDIAEDALRERRKQTAMEIFERAATLEIALADFLASSEGLRERDVRTIQVDQIWLHDRNDPELAEVHFLADRVDEGWSCVVKHGAFRDLRYSPG